MELLPDLMAIEIAEPEICIDHCEFAARSRACVDPGSVMMGKGSIHDRVPMEDMVDPNHVRDALRDTVRLLDLGRKSIDFSA